MVYGCDLRTSVPTVNVLVGFTLIFYPGGRWEAIAVGGSGRRAGVFSKGTGEFTGNIRQVGFLSLLQKSLVHRLDPESSLVAPAASTTLGSTVPSSKTFDDHRDWIVPNRLSSHGVQTGDRKKDMPS